MNAFVVSSSKTLPASKQKHIRPLHVETRSAASNWELKNMVKKLAHVTVLFFCFSYFILFFPIFFFKESLSEAPPSMMFLSLLVDPDYLTTIRCLTGVRPF